jgi:hypothetical protein
MQQPPLLPEAALARVLRVSRANGMSVVLVAGFFALLAAMAGDVAGAIGGLVVAGAGAMEVHGNTLLRHHDARGMKWLITSQVVCLMGILAYCGVRLAMPLIPPIPAWARPMVAAQAEPLGLTPEQFMIQSYPSSILLVALVSLCYQGGMALYYLLRRRAVLKAVNENEAEAEQEA